METALVTGGCGLIGQHIVSGLLKKGFAVIAIDKDENDYNVGKPNYTFIKAEATDKNVVAELLEKNDIYLLVHAAYTVDNDIGAVIDESVIKQSSQVDKYLYRYAMSEKVRKIVVLSTDQVYDFPKTREPIQEDSDLRVATNYAAMKYASEKALVTELNYHLKKKNEKDESTVCCVARIAPIYTRDYTENLIAKLIDPKDGVMFVSGKGQYGFQMCCLYNLIDFVLCFATASDDEKYSGIYNVCDKLLTTAADIITFMRENHTLGSVVQRAPTVTISKLRGLFGSNKEEKINYRYLDVTKLENNNMLDTTRATQLTTFNWDIHNTK